jgi:hypothetical protein
VIFAWSGDFNVFKLPGMQDGCTDGTGDVRIALLWGRGERGKIGTRSIKDRCPD